MCVYIYIYICIYIYIYIYVYTYICCTMSESDLTIPWTPGYTFRRRENMVGANMVGVSNVVHDAICECFEGIMLEPCLLQPCFHVAGPWPHTPTDKCTHAHVCVYIYIYTIYTCMYVYIYIYIERERDREREVHAHACTHRHGCKLASACVCTCITPSQGPRDNVQRL